MKKLVILLISLAITSEANAQTKVYFPPKKKGGLSSFEQNWFSGQFSALSEPVIWNNGKQSDVYRFTWLRTFHHPVAIRIEKNGNTYNLYWKMCNGASGYRPGKLIVDKHKVIYAVTWNFFITKLSQVDFWNFFPVSEMGNDGAEWILEGKAGTKYHLIDEWTPKSSDKYYQCCDFLLSLTGLKIPPDEKY